MRAVLAEEPTLAAELMEPAAAPLLAPLVQPPLDAGAAAGLDLILEGFLLHHGRPRHLAPSGSGREVLAGDYCYANGLVRVAASGDLFIVEALANLIALGAGLVAAGSSQGLAPLWRATMVAIAARRSPAQEETTRRFLAAQRALASDGDVSGMVALAGELAPTPGLAEALTP